MKTTFDKHFFNFHHFNQSFPLIMSDDVTIIDENMDKSNNNKKKTKRSSKSHDKEEVVKKRRKKEKKNDERRSINDTDTSTIINSNQSSVITVSTEDSDKDTPYQEKCEEDDSSHKELDFEVDFDSTVEELLACPDASPVHRVCTHFRNPTKEESEELTRLRIKIRRGVPYSEEECFIIKKVFQDYAIKDLMRTRTEINEENYNDYMTNLLGFFRVNRNRTSGRMEGRGWNKRSKLIMRILINIGKRVKGRTMISIYQKARVILNPMLSMRELSEEQKQEVIDHIVKHPTLTQSQIGEIFNITPKTVNIIQDNRVTSQKKVAKLGKWSPDEDANLIKAVMTTTKCDKIEETLTKPIKWTDVAKLVTTRTRKHSETRFMGSLLWKIGVISDLITSKDDVDNRMSDLSKIIYFIHMSIHEKLVKATYQDIDWDKLCLMLPHLELRVMMKLFDDLLDSVSPKMKDCTFKKRVKWLFNNKLQQFCSVNGDDMSELEAFWQSSKDY